MQEKLRASRGRGVILFYAGFVFLLTAVAAFWRIYNAEHPPRTYQEHLIPQAEGSGQQEKVNIEVGMLINNVYNFEAIQKTFDADGWIWLKWPPEIEQAMKQHHVLPQELFYFFNLVNGYDSSVIPAGLAPKRTPDGGYYTRFQFTGHFIANELNFRKFPFQTLKFPLALEIRQSTRLGLDYPVGMKIDYKNSGLGAYIDLGGYITEGFTLARYTHIDESSLGDPDFGSEPRQVSQARMEISYQKSSVATILKILLPLIAVMALSLISPSISATGWDVRVGIPPTALLSLIFLQQAYQSWLPELSYITFLDTVYNVCYLTNLILFGLFLWGTNTLKEASSEDRPAVVEHIEKVDRLFQKALLLMMVVMVSVNWYVMSIRS